MTLIAFALLSAASAVPASSLDVTFPDGLWNGRITVIEVHAPDTIASLTGALAGKAIITLPASPDGKIFLALAPLDIEWRARTAPLVLDAVLVSGMKVHLAARAPVDTAPYPEAKLTVDKQFIQPPAAQRARAAKENRTLDDALAHPSPERLWRGSFQKPVPGVETSPFGTRRTYMSKDGPSKHNRHYGWDLNGATGDLIVAANRGRVALAADRFYSGGTVLLDHGQGLFTMYFHMSRIDVKDGDVVEKGQRLGAVGASGQVTGPHLHFSVKLDGMYQDGKYLMALDLSADALK